MITIISLLWNVGDLEEDLAPIWMVNDPSYAFCHLSFCGTSVAQRFPLKSEEEVSGFFETQSCHVMFCCRLACDGHMMFCYELSHARGREHPWVDSEGRRCTKTHPQ